MGKTYKPRHLVLKKFCEQLLELNPMELNLTGNPGAANEYDQEALSILARFNEAAIQCCPQEDVAVDICAGIVQETFVFWFNEPIRDTVRLREVTVTLMKTYDDSYPGIERSEQLTTGEIVSSP